SPSLASSRKRTEKLKVRNELLKEKNALEYTLVKKLVRDEIKNDVVIQGLDKESAAHQKAADDLKKYKEMRHGLATDIKDVNPEQVKFAKQEYFKAKGEYEKLNGWQKFWADRLPVSLYGKADLVAKMDAYKEVFNDLGVTPETLDAEYAKDVKEKENKSLADEVNKIEQIDINGKDEVRVKDNDLNMALGDLTDLEKSAQNNEAQKTQYKRFEVQLDEKDKKIDAPQINVPKN
ncbi:MAG: hypothetical protein MJ193_01855, partial [Clostridia bacterium]|nr:hypothetical protein [Clostridia bacterium]